MAALERTRLLILDDWGLEPFNAEQRRDLSRSSMIATTEAC